MSERDAYDAAYYAKRLTDAWRRDEYALARGIDERFTPESVLDLGCAVGHHLAWFRDRGRAVRGVDLHPAAFEHTVIPTAAIDEHDLTEPYRPDQAFDVVVCIEVAEHLPASAADTLVETCTRCARDAVVFSAATPDAQGRGHINEQPRAYWRRRFEAAGWRVATDELAALRDAVTTEAKHWVPDRLFVFVDGGEA